MPPRQKKRIIAFVCVNPSPWTLSSLSKKSFQDPFQFRTSARYAKVFPVAFGIQGRGLWGFGYLEMREMDVVVRIARVVMTYWGGRFSKGGYHCQGGWRFCRDSNFPTMEPHQNYFTAKNHISYSGSFPPSLKANKHISRFVRTGEGCDVGVYIILKKRRGGRKGCWVPARFSKQGGKSVWWSRLDRDSPAQHIFLHVLFPLPNNPVGNEIQLC